MDVLLIGIAALSLILAIGMGLILFKVLNDERQRSDARVAALAAASATVDLPLASQVPWLQSPRVGSNWNSSPPQRCALLRA